MRICGEVYLGIPCCMNCVCGWSVLVCCCYRVASSFDSSDDGTKKIFVRFGQRYDSYKTAGYRLSSYRYSSVTHTVTRPRALFQPIQSRCVYRMSIAVMAVPFNIGDSLVKDAVDDHRDTIWHIGPDHHSCNTTICESSQYHQTTNHSGPNDQKQFRSTTPMRYSDLSFLLLL